MLGRDRAGLEQVAVDYAEAFALAGVEALTVIDHKAQTRTALEESGAPTALVHRGFGAGWQLARIDRARKVDAIVTHGNRALRSARFARLLGVTAPIIAVAHNYNTGRFDKADAAIAITKDLEEHLKNQGITVARVANATRVPAERPPRRPFRSPMVVGALGRLVPKKGFDVLIQALGAAARQGTALTTRLAGDGPLLNQLRRDVERAGVPDIEFCGWCDRNEFLASIDVLVVPSLHEPFGLVAIEAMAAGVPLITTASEGPREVVQDGITGRVVPVGDPGALANALVRVAGEEAEARRMADAAYAECKRLYSIEFLAQQLPLAVSLLCCQVRGPAGQHGHPASDHQGHTCPQR